MHVDESSVRRVAVAPPHLFQQDVAGEDLARLACEGDQQIELERGGERDRHAVAGDLVRGHVDLHRADREQFGRFLVGAAQAGAHPCDEFLRLERLDHVVVGAGFETQHDVDGVGLRRQHDDRDTRVGAQHTAHVDAVHAREHEVEEHEIRTDLPHRGECLRSVTDHEGFETLTAQHDRQHLGESGVVVDDQDARLHVFNGDTIVMKAW